MKSPVADRPKTRRRREARRDEHAPLPLSKQISSIHRAHLLGARVAASHRCMMRLALAGGAALRGGWRERFCDGGEFLEATTRAVIEEVATLPWRKWCIE